MRASHLSVKGKILVHVWFMSSKKAVHELYVRLYGVKTWLDACQNPLCMPKKNFQHVEIFKLSNSRQIHVSSIVHVSHLGTFLAPSGRRVQAAKTFVYEPKTRRELCVALTPPVQSTSHWRRLVDACFLPKFWRR